MYRSKITVTLRKSILDPQGKAVEQSIHALGFSAVQNVRVGKFVELTVDATNRQEAERLTNEVCRKLLANPVMEDFSFVLEEGK